MRRSLPLGAAPDRPPPPAVKHNYPLSSDSHRHCPTLRRTDFESPRRNAVEMDGIACLKLLRYPITGLAERCCARAPTGHAATHPIRPMNRAASLPPRTPDRHRSGSKLQPGMASPMSASGHKRTFAPQKVMSALPPKAGMCSATRDVRFVPIADVGAPVSGKCELENGLHTSGTRRHGNIEMLYWFGIHSAFSCADIHHRLPDCGSSYPKRTQHRKTRFPLTAKHLVPIAMPSNAKK